MRQEGLDYNAARTKAVAYLGIIRVGATWPGQTGGTSRAGYGRCWLDRGRLLCRRAIRRRRGSRRAPPLRRPHPGRDPGWAPRRLHRDALLQRRQHEWVLRGANRGVSGRDRDSADPQRPRGLRRGGSAPLALVKGREALWNAEGASWLRSRLNRKSPRLN